MPEPITNQKITGVSSAPTTRLGCRKKRTTSRRPSPNNMRALPALAHSTALSW